MPRPFTVGIVGAGAILSHHLEAIRGTGAFSMVGVCDTDPGRLAAAAASAGCEGFADRQYEADGTLRNRKLPGALITDPAAAAAQAVRLARAGAAETICVHGDTPGAPAILRACREALFAPGVV